MWPGRARRRWRSSLLHRLDLVPSKLGGLDKLRPVHVLGAAEADGAGGLEDLVCRPQDGLLFLLCFLSGHVRAPCDHGSISQPVTIAVSPNWVSSNAHTVWPDQSV